MPLAIFCGCTARVVWDQVKKPRDRFSHNEAQMTGNPRLQEETPPNENHKITSYWKQKNQLFLHQNNLSLILRKPVFGVSDQVRHKPGCTATEDG